MICAVGDVGIDLYTDQNSVRPGGCSLNFSCHYRLNDHDQAIHLVSALGTQTNNSSILDCINKYRISSELQYLEGLSPLQPIALAKNGEKIFSNYQTNVLSQLVLSDKQLNWVYKSKLVMTPFSPETEHIVEQITRIKPQNLRAIDFMNLSDYSLADEKLRAILSITDFGFFGLQNHQKTLISSIQELSQKLKKVFIVTLAEKGCIAFSSGVEISAPVDNPVEMVDSTGAGDSFAAAFLAHHLNGISIEDSLNLANQHAAKTVSYLGAIPYFN